MAIYDEAQAGLSPEQRAALVEGLNTIVANLSAAEVRAETEPDGRKAAGARP